MAKRKIRKNTKIKKIKQNTPIAAEMTKPKIKLKPLLLKILCFVLAIMLIATFAILFPLGNG
ncbi:MAG: hypothetical protein LBM87_03420 [Ruminococcus sp.]|jgi:hypothetical protein|nr:hypothetical protein [Ruminococcus sp.]